MVLKWVCPKCKRIIISSTIGQQKNNSELHLDKHKRNEEKKRMKEEGKRDAKDKKNKEK